MQHSSRKNEILNVAAELFKERGYRAVTMRDIAKTLDIKASSLYNHIQSKQELLSDLIICVAEDFTNGMDAILALHCSNTEKLKKAIALHIDITLQSGNALVALNNDWMHLQDNRAYFLSMRSRYEDSFRKIITNGIQAKEFEPRNVELVVFSFLSTLQTFHLWYSKRAKTSPTQLKQDMINVLMQGVVKQSN